MKQMSIKRMLDKFLVFTPAKERKLSFIFLMMPFPLLGLLWLMLPKTMNYFLNSLFGTLFFILYTLSILGWIVMDKRIKKYKSGVN